MSAWQPTAALVRAVVLGSLLAVAGLLLHRPDVVVLAAPFVVLAAAPLLLRPTGRPVVEVQVRDRFVPEGRGTVVRTILRGCPGIEQVTRLVGATPYVATRPPAGAVSVTADRASDEVRVDVAVSPRRWGVRGVGEGRVAATAAWGGFRWGPVPISLSTLTVLPEPAPFDTRAEAPHPLGLIGVNRSRRHGDGTEFSGIRPFTAGDRLRRIHWRTSLRTGDLHVVTTTSEEDSAVLLLVDATVDVGVSGGLDGAASSLDATVRAAGALADHHLRVGDRVSLRVLGRYPLVVPVGTGSRHRQRILGTLARVRPGEAEELDTRRLQLGLAPGTVVFVLSPLLAPALTTTVVSLARRGLPVVAVDTLPPTDGSVGRSEDADLDRLAWRMRMLERRLQLTEIARTGTPVVAWRGPGSLDEVMHRLTRRAQLPRGGVPVIRGIPRAQLALRAVVLLAPWVVVGSARLAGGADARPLDVVVLVAGILTAARPDSPSGTVLLVAAAATWLVGRPAVVSPWLLLASAALVVTHVATLVAAQGPPRMAVDLAQLRLWAPRALLAWGATVGTWVALRLLDGAPHPTVVYAAGLVLLTATAVAVTVQLRATRA